MQQILRKAYRIYERKENRKAQGIKISMANRGPYDYEKHHKLINVTLVTWARCPVMDHILEVLYIEQAYKKPFFVLLRAGTELNRHVRFELIEKYFRNLM